MALRDEALRGGAERSEVLAMGGRSFTERVHDDPGIGARHRAIDTDGLDRIVPEPRGCFIP